MPSQTTQTFYSDNAHQDSYLWQNDNSTWANCHNGTGTKTGTHVTKVGTFYYSSAYYHCYRGRLGWNTAALAGKTILSAYLSGVSNGYGSVIDTDTLVVVNGDGLNQTDTDYQTLLSNSTNYGQITSAAFPVNGQPFTITLNATGIAAINKTGWTVFGMRSQRDINNTDPNPTSGDSKYFTFECTLVGVTDGLKLVVTYLSSNSPANNQIVTGLRHIYNRKRDDLEITFGGYSTKEELIAPEIMKIADDVTIPQVTEPKKVVPKINTEDIYK